MTTGIRGIGMTAMGVSNDLSDLATRLDEIEATGLSFVELPLYDLDCVIAGRIHRPQLEAVKKITSSRALTYTAHGPHPINFFDDMFRLPRHFEVLKASMEAAAELGAVHYVVHAGMTPLVQAAGLEAAYERQREWLTRGGDLAKALGLMLCVENIFGDYHGKIHTPTPKRLAQELALINHSHVWATLDVGHAFIETDFYGLDLVTECAALAPYALHIHMHDNFGRQDDIVMYTESERLAFGHGDLHLPMGLGGIDWDALFNACIFPDRAIFNIELARRYWHWRQDCVEAMKALHPKIKTQAV